MNVSRLSQKAAAELLAVTPRTLRTWPDAPRNEDGTYPGPALVAWFIVRNTPDEVEVDDQRQRLAAAQAEKVETDNALRRGELARKQDVVKFWTDVLVNVRARLLRIPSECMAAVPTEHRVVVQDVVRRGVYSALTELSEWEPERPRQ